MKKFILPIIALLASGVSCLAQTGSVTTSEFIVNSGSIPILISGSTKASGTLTLNMQPSAGNTFTLSSSSGTTAYTYVAALTGSAAGQAQILISGSLAGTLANTYGAINGSGTNAGWDSPGAFTVATGTTGTGNTVILTATASGTAGNGINTTGSFASAWADYFGGTALAGGAVASGTDIIYTLPANGGSYVFTAADVLCLSGTLTAAPSMVIQSGSATLLSGTVSLTGTTANNLTHFTAVTAPLPVVVTGTNATPIQLKITTTGTATSPFEVKVFLKGYWLTLP